LCVARQSATRSTMALTALTAAGRWALDFALPPRCAGCGEIIGDVHGFCPDCWSTIDFLRGSLCLTCGIPLEATEAGQCGGCLARPPIIARTRAAIVYGDIARSIAIRLKYGRKVALARTMARFMAPLIDRDRDSLLLVPVPLHRWRLWGRGFNQSVLIARALAPALGIAQDPLVLKRTRATPPLKAMSMAERRRAVSGAFAVSDPARIDGKTIILVDDVLTTGSTAEACARVLTKAGAARVELVAWARVVRPRRLDS
jgi:ComF family protein